MKVLFIYKLEGFMVPIGLCFISAVARKSGHETYLCEINIQKPLECIERIQPDVVAYSASSGEAKHYAQLNKIIKEKWPDIFTIMGGPHATFYPQLIQETTLDAICVGEGEEGFVDALEALSEGRSVDGIPNIFTPSASNYEVHDLIEDLDSLPFPDYDLFYNTTPLGMTPLKSFMASRGCPYKCTYCFNTAWRKIYQGHGKMIRRHSVDYLIMDIERVKKKWPLSCVKFYDDIFVYRVDDWLKEFVREYRKRIGIPFFILTRADLLTEGIVKLLKFAGCRTISMSIEAGDQKIRNEMLKRAMSNEQIIKAYRLCEKYGIYTFTNCIIGLPGTQIEDDIKSLDLAIEAKATWAEFPIFYPYPGTELGDKAISMGMYTPDYNKMHTSNQSGSPLNCFDEKEHNMLSNLTILGPIAVVFPKLRGLIVNHLICWPHNRFFIFIYWLVKNYVVRHRIYYTKTTFWESLRIFTKSLKQEIFRHTEEKIYPWETGKH